MNREERLTAIFNQFDESANAFCRKTKGNYCEIESEYKGIETASNLNYRFAQIYYNSFIIEFKYTAHGVMGVTNSILECLIYLGKCEHNNFNIIGIPLPFMWDYLDKNTYIPLCVPLITSPLGMNQAFECIGNAVEYIFEDIEKLCDDTERKAEFYKRYKDELNILFEIKPEDPEEFTEEFYVSEVCYKYLTLRFSAAPFLNYLKGKKDKAIKELGKTKNLLGYEKRVLSIWESGEEIIIPDLSEIINNAQSYADSGAPKGNIKELITLFVSWILLTPLTALFYCGIYYLLLLVEKQGSIYLMGPNYNIYMCFLFAFITSIALSYFTRFKFHKFFFKSDYERFCEMDHVQNGSGSDKFMKGFTAVIVAISLIGCLLLTKWGVNFLPDGFVDNTKFFSLKGEYHIYNDIKQVYYKANRVNDFGDKLDFPSYVLELKNGKKIDFYDYDEIENYEKTLIPELKEKGVKVIKDN